eukprot:GHRQ01037630.1.p1 GENE.GHRQ01037630.1~~GHRQ01037630.1.p1  ORF type:complete len:130 (-),score=56.87 GHRQ01037630.1:290-679(-)
MQDVTERESNAAAAGGAGSGGGMGSSVGARFYALLDTIIGNLQLKITNVHVRYEDSSSNPGHSFCIGLMLQEISASTANEDWRAAFVTAGALLTLRKVGWFIGTGDRGAVAGAYSCISVSCYGTSRLWQ